ncbi:MAG: peptide ABC transporter substrate-binding protein [Dehalococcoidia bacterium]
MSFKKYMKIKNLKLYYAMAFMMILLGCSDDNDTPFSSESSTSNNTLVDNSCSNEQLTDNTLNILYSDPPTLDPHIAQDSTSASIILELYSGLVTLGTDLKITPDLAESWSISDDGLKYTFTIRDNAKFHDGKKITASDFLWSFNRAANPSTTSTTAEDYLGDIIGVADVIAGKTSTISGIKMIDDQTIEINIDAPKAYFLAKLTYPVAFVLDKQNLSDPDWIEKPNGSGPFTLDEYFVGEKLILKRNNNWHKDIAKLDYVSMNLAGGSAMAMYENCEIDITGVGMSDLERVLDPSNILNKDVVVAPLDFSQYYIGFNLNEAPFDDIYFRQALAYSINKELIATEVLSDLVKPAYGILPPGFPGYNENISGFKHDELLAKEALAKSKYSDVAELPRLILSVPGTGGSAGLDIEVILEMWKQTLGIDVEIQQLEWATFLQMLNKKELQFFSGLGWVADYPDPENFLDVNFHSTKSTNHNNYSNPEVDSLLELARVEPDITTRLDLYNKAEKIIVNESPWIPLWFPGDQYVLINQRVKNYKLTPMSVPKYSLIEIVE